MADQSNTPGKRGSGVQFLGDGEILEIREEDTTPGKGLSEKSRKMLEEKYGRKTPPPNGPADGPGQK